jgi:hypothetical protein
MDHAVSLAQIYIRDHAEFTGEDIRLFCQGLVSQPTSPNVWGALTKELIRRKMIRPSGHYRQMRDPSSHARMTMVYTRL